MTAAPTRRNVRTKTAAITAQNQFTDWVEIDGAEFAASLVDDGSTLSCTWTVQGRLILPNGDVGSTQDIFTSSALSNGGLQIAELPGKWEVRVGVKTGNYTAGSGVASISW